jgi:hypothetical protein
LASNRGDEERSRSYVADGQKANPDLANFQALLSGCDALEGHDEDQLQDFHREEILVKGAGAREMDAAAIPAFLRAGEAFASADVGDYRDALAKYGIAAGGGGAESVAANSATFAVWAHDIALTRQFIGKLVIADSSYT